MGGGTRTIMMDDVLVVQSIKQWLRVAFLLEQTFINISRITQEVSLLFDVEDRSGQRLN